MIVITIIEWTLLFVAFMMIIADIFFKAAIPDGAEDIIDKLPWLFLLTIVLIRAAIRPWYKSRYLRAEYLAEQRAKIPAAAQLTDDQLIGLATDPLKLVLIGLGLVVVVIVISLLL